MQTVFCQNAFNNDTLPPNCQICTKVVPRNNQGIRIHIGKVALNFTTKIWSLRYKYPSELVLSVPCPNLGWQ